MILLVLIAAGNTAFPIFLRLVMYVHYSSHRRLLAHAVSMRSWTMSKISRSNRDTLQFLLDHPRRCYIYLFPSRQTWYLLFVLVLLKFVHFLVSSSIDLTIPFTLVRSPGLRSSFSTSATRSSRRLGRWGRESSTLSSSPSRFVLLDSLSSRFPSSLPPSSCAYPFPRSYHTDADPPFAA